MNLNKTNLLIKMFLLVCLVLILPAKTVYAADIPIFVDNVPVYSEVSPFYSKDTLLVPARLVSEELGATVDWQDEQISINSGDCHIVLYVGQNQAEVNGTSQNLSAPPQIVQGRLFVPLRFVGEALEAEVLYHKGKIFIYSSEYDEKIFLYDMPTNGMAMRKPTNIAYNGKMYSLIKDRVHTYNNENGNIITLHIDNSPVLLLAISRSGLVYRNDALSEDVGTFYYNFDNQEIMKMFVKPLFSANTSNFSKNGCFYFSDFSKNKEYKTRLVGDSQFYQSIFSADIDGTNIREVFTEEPNYYIYDIQSYDGWIYYVTGVPVIRDYGIDHYIGSLNRVRIDGTNKQQLTDEHISQYYFTNDGIYYEYAYGRGSGLLKYEDLD